jgi:hypothetical protein
MESLGDLVPLPSPFAPSELAADASVVRLLPTELAPSFLVTVLDGGDLREGDGDRDGLSSAPNEHPIEGALVRVEREERGGRVRLRNFLGEDEGRSVRSEPELLDLRVGETLAVVVGQGEVEARPLPGSEGEAEVSGARVEMKIVAIGEEEQLADVRGQGGSTASESGAVPPGQGDGEVGGEPGVAEEDVVLAGEGLSGGDERPAGGSPSIERLADGEVDEEAEVAHERGNRRG